MTLARKAASLGWELIVELYSSDCRTSVETDFLRIPNDGIVIEQFSEVALTIEAYYWDSSHTDHASSGVRLATTLHATDKGREWYVCIQHNPKVLYCVPCSGGPPEQRILRR